MPISPSLTRSARAMSAGVAIVSLVAGVLLSAAPARADAAIAVVGSNGTVGTSQSVTASAAPGGASGQITYYANGAEFGRGTIDAAGTATQVSWTPTVAGTVTLTAVFVALGGTAVPAQPRDVVIEPVQTQTNTVSPGTAKVGSTITVTATVTSNGQYRPTGNVQFSYLDGTAIASIAVNARGQAALVIQVPSEPQSVSFVASYLGDGSAKASSSSPDAVLITPTGSTVALSVPQTNVLRVPTTLVATITPASAGGTVTFSVGNVVVGSQAVAKGQASVEWTPQGAGAFTVSASYSGDRGTPRGTATNQVVVVAETRADSITVDPVGAAGAWVPGGSVTFMNGTSMALATSSTSNMPVQLAESGPCMLAGNRLTARSGSGSCTVTALTRSGNGFSGAANTYRVLLTPGWQTARLAAPASGVVNRGAVVKLGKPNLRTTAGQLVTWKVTAGKAQCSVVFTSDGTAKLKARKRGPCNIRATAPGVDGQWNRYAVYRAYVIR